MLAPQFFHRNLPYFLLSIFFIAHSPATAEELTPERQAVIARMQPPLLALAQAADGMPLTREGAGVLDFYLEAAGPFNSDREREKFLQRLQAYAQRYMLVRSVELLSLAENLWTAAGFAPSEAGPQFVFRSDPWIEPRELTKEFAFITHGRMDLVATPLLAFTDVYIFFRSTWTKPNDFYSLVFSAVIHAIQNSPSLEAILPLLNKTIYTLSGKETNESNHALAEATPPHLYVQDDEKLFELLIQEGEKLPESTLTSTSSVWYRSDLPQNILELRNSLMHRQESSAAFDYLAELLGYKLQTGLTVETDLLKWRLLDFLRQRQLRPGKFGSRIGAIHFAERAHALELISTEELVKTTLIPVSESIFQRLDSVWSPGHNPMQITYSEAIARAELGALLRTLSHQRKQLINPAIQSGLKEFYLQLLFRDPTLDAIFIQQRLRDTENGTDKPEDVKYFVFFKKRMKGNGLLYRPDGADVLKMQLTPELFGTLKTACREFQKFYAQRNEEGRVAHDNAAAYLEEQLCSSHL